MVTYNVLDDESVIEMRGDAFVDWPRILPATLTVREIIQGARDLIADESRWTKGHLAVGSGVEINKIAAMFDVPAKFLGKGSVEPTSPLAEEWCAVGSMMHVAGISKATTFVHSLGNGPNFRRACALLNERARAMYPELDEDFGVAQVNDRLGHEATIAVFDKVLADETLV